MRYNKLLPHCLSVFFMFLLMILIFGNKTLNVEAVSDESVRQAATIMSKYDGITNWKLKNNSTNDVGKIPIGGNVSLGYAFGAARDSSNNVASGDRTLTTNSTTGTVNNAPTINNSKINIFLNNNGKYYGILHQGANSYNDSSSSTATPQKASDTSIDFALLTGSTLSNDYYSGSNILAKATYKNYYVGYDDENRIVLKIAGYYNSGLYFEMVLRPSTTGAPVVSRELYVYNDPTISSNNTRSFQTFYGEDTGLSPNMDTAVDNVPMFAIGNGEGLYLESGSTFKPASKLFVTNTLPDGFKDFMGRVLTNPTNWAIKGRLQATYADLPSPRLPYTTDPNHPAEQNGDTADKKDTNLLRYPNSSGVLTNVVDNSGKQDTAYVLRWTPTDLAPGKVAHFASNIGATVAGYAIPTFRKTYTNLTSSDGNNVGDTLKFTLTVRNDGYRSQWDVKNVKDTLPTGLTLVPGSVQDSSWIDGNNININPNNLGIADNGEQVYTFRAKINNEAPYHLNNGYITNRASVTGNNTGASDSKTLTDSVNIPIKIPSFNHTFTKQVRNDTTNPGGDFSQSVNAKKGETVEYRVLFKSTGTASLTGGNFTDTLPAGLELESNSVYLNGVQKDSLKFPIGSLANNTDNTIIFKAKVTSIDASTASNTAYINNATISDGTQRSSLETSEPAIVNIQAAPKTTSLDEVPTAIDFGSINMSGKETVIPNKSTTGDLSITHTEDTPFQVTVSYNNDGDDSIKSGDNKLIQDNGESLLFNQSSDTGTNSWQPLSPTGTPIKSDGFSGTYTKHSLAKYIGTDKWKLRIPSNAKSGQYTGQVTWSIYDTPVN